MGSCVKYFDPYILNLSKTRKYNFSLKRTPLVAKNIKSYDFDLDVKGSGEFFLAMRRILPNFKVLTGNAVVTVGIKNFDQLPENAKKYIYAVEDFIGAKISSISTSPEREDTILLENPFSL